MAFGAVMLCSCKDSGNEIEPEKEADTDYLVMFYALGGGNMDRCIIANIMQALDEGSSERLKMTFEYKLSDSLHTVEALKSFDGIRWR